MKNIFLRHSSDLDFSFFYKRRKLLVKGSQGSFLFPVQDKLIYSKKDKKLFLSYNPVVLMSYQRLHYILLMQASLGVLLGYRKQLNIVGIGYSVELQENVLTLKLGFSHNVVIKIPHYLKVLCPKPRIILIKGICLQKINNFAYILRKLKLPSCYKEKGIFFSGQIVKLKQGKKT